MAYLRKDQVLDALKEDMHTSLMCCGNQDAMQVVNFCYESMERAIDHLPQYRPESVEEVEDE